MCSWSVVVFIKSTARLKSDIEDCRTNVDLLLAQLCNFNLNLLIMTKGQLISECLFDVLNFQKKKKTTKNLTNFCPESKKWSNHIFLYTRAEICQIFRWFFGKFKIIKKTF